MLNVSSVCLSVVGVVRQSFSLLLLYIFSNFSRQLPAYKYEYLHLSRKIPNSSCTLSVVITYYYIYSYYNKLGDLQKLAWFSNNNKMSDVVAGSAGARAPTPSRRQSQFVVNTSARPVCAASPRVDMCTSPRIFWCSSNT